jgi:hypothetical protein
MKREVVFNRILGRISDPALVKSVPVAPGVSL